MSTHSFDPRDPTHPQSQDEQLLLAIRALQGSISQLTKALRITARRLELRLVANQVARQVAAELIANLAAGQGAEPPAEEAAHPDTREGRP